MSATHKEALASLLYGVDSGCGFLALIATPGLGKTTILFHLLNQLREKALTVFLFQTVCTPLDLLRALLTGLGVQETQGSLIQLQLQLKDILVEQARRGKRVVVVIDEAQNLDDSVLELIRMLSNFETAREKLIQIILSGQPQLAEKINAIGLEQLRQRISIFAQLKPFSREETQLYIEHRLRVAGYGFESPLFTRDAYSLIAQHSDGIPRNINNICFNSLSLACAMGRKLIDSEVIREVMSDLDLERFSKKAPALALRTPAEQESAPAEPELFSAAGKPPMFAGWAPRFAVALLALLVLGGAIFAGFRRVELYPALHIQRASNQNADTQSSATASKQGVPSSVPQATIAGGTEAHTVAVPLSQDDPSPAHQETTTPAAAVDAPESIVSVMPGKTLMGICVDSFGKCNSELLQQIRKLNPQLSDLDHIETGQQIHLPARAIAVRTGNAGTITP